MWLLALSLTLLTTAQAQAQTLDVTAPGHHAQLSLIEMKSKLKSQTIEVDDPAYKKVKQYDAFLFADVLKLAGVSTQEHADEIVFTAVDGYAPNTSAAMLKAYTPYLAYQDHATPGRFARLDQGKDSISPWPFYLVWKEGAKKLKSEVPWPYQLTKIELVDWSVKYPHVVLKNFASDSPEMKGFVLFKAHCMRCHSINTEGGVLGPELNVPKNITEYWQPDVLKAFVKNVSAFRYKDKMPDFTELKDEELDRILVYLKAMKNNKIAVH